MRFSLKDHVYRPGDGIEMQIFNHPDHRTGVVEQVINDGTRGMYLSVKRADGRVVDIDPEEDAVRLTPASAYRYARFAGLNLIDCVLFLRREYEMTLTEAKIVMSQSPGENLHEIQAALAKELEPLLKD